MVIPFIIHRHTGQTLPLRGAGTPHALAGRADTGRQVGEQGTQGDAHQGDPGCHRAGSRPDGRIQRTRKKDEQE